jgi:hypothetical protein
MQIAQVGLVLLLVDFLIEASGHFCTGSAMASSSATCGTALSSLSSFRLIFPLRSIWLLPRAMGLPFVSTRDPGELGPEARLYTIFLPIPA